MYVYARPNGNSHPAYIHTHARAFVSIIHILNCQSLRKGSGECGLLLLPRVSFFSIRPARPPYKRHGIESERNTAFVSLSWAFYLDPSFSDCLSYMQRALGRLRPGQDERERERERSIAIIGGAYSLVIY